MKKLILIEGIPGTGKSYLAEQLCCEMNKRGFPSIWHKEESHDHPVYPIQLKKKKYRPEFLALSHEVWCNFVENFQQQEKNVILEGSLFQSSIRFLLEANRENQVPEYQQEIERLLSSIMPFFIFLEPKDYASHVEWVMGHRGQEWSKKVADYLAKSPFCKEMKWSNHVTMQKFWPYYARYCKKLFLSSSFEKRSIQVNQGSLCSSLDEIISELYQN